MYAEALASRFWNGWVSNEDAAKELHALLKLAEGQVGEEGALACLARFLERLRKEYNE